MKRRYAYYALEAMVVCIILLIVFWPRPSEFDKVSSALMKLDRDKTFEALRSYSQTFKTSGKPVPAAVSLNELIAHGYLKKDEVGILDRLNVTFSTSWDETKPSEVVISVFLPQGREILEFADGSIMYAPPNWPAASSRSATNTNSHN